MNYKVEVTKETRTFEHTSSHYFDNMSDAKEIYATWIKTAEMIISEYESISVTLYGESCGPIMSEEFVRF